MIYRQKLYFLIVIAYFWGSRSLAQVNLDTIRYNVETLTVDDGLSQGLISCILQDKEGLMWFGTKDGLNKYDGYRFTVFRYNDKNPWSIQGNYITGIVEDDRGYLWVGTYANGLFIFDKQTERFYPVKTHFEETEKLVQTICPLSYHKGNILFVNEHTYVYINEHAYVYRADHVNPKKEGKLELKREDLVFDGCQFDTLLNSSNNYRIVSKHFENNGGLWFASNDSMILFQGNGNSPYTIQQVISMAKYNLQNNLPKRVVTIPGKPLLLFFGLDQFVVIDTLLKKRILNYSFPSTATTLRNVCRDLQGNYFIMADEEFFKYIPTENKLYAIATGKLGGMYVDKNNVLWIGNGGLGIYKIDQRKNLFHHFNPPGVLHSAVSSKKEILVRQKKTMSNILKKLEYVHPITLQSREVIPQQEFTRRKGKFVINCSENKQEMIVMTTSNGTWNNDIYLEAYDPKQLKLTSKQIGVNYEMRNVQLFADNKDQLWINYIDKKKKSWISAVSDDGQHLVQPFRMPGNAISTGETYILSVYHADNHIIWLATIQGFYRFNPKASTPKEQWRHYTFIDKRGNYTPLNDMLSVLPDPLNPDKELWIGTEGGGLLHFDIAKEKFHRYTIEHGLPNDVVYGVLNDDEGNLWMSTNAGLSCFLRKQKRFVNFNVEDGLPGNEFNRYEYHKLDKDHLYFAGTAGGVYFNPKEILAPELKPNIVFTGLTVNNKPVHFLKDSLILQKPIQFAEQISIPSDKNIFTVSFSALNYGGGLKKFYRYKLIGYSNDWVDAGNRNEASYTNLSPGSYTLYVQAAGRNGDWNPEGISLNISIQPKWFQTWLFKLSVLASIVLLSYLLYRYRLRQQVKILTMRNTIAADLHDEMGSALSSITLFSEVADKMSAQQNILNEVVNKIKTNALEVQETMSDIVWAINTRHETLDQLLKRMRGFAVHVAETQQFELIFPTDEHIPTRPLDPLQRKNLYLVFKEAFNNVVKYAHCTQIQIAISLDQNLFQLSIIDNGKGFHLTDQSFEPTNRGGGNGLFNMTKRVEALGGKLTIQSVIHGGTTVHVAVKLITPKQWTPRWWNK